MDNDNTARSGKTVSVDESHIQESLSEIVRGRVRGLASELRADAMSAKLPAALSTGLVVAVLVLVMQSSLAAIIFSGPLAAFIGWGTGAILFGNFVFCLVAALASTYRGSVSVPNFAPGAVLLTIGGAVAANESIGHGEDLFVTMVVIIMLSSLTTALCFLFIGWFRLAHFFRFMPYTLVGGFLAGLGWFLLLSGVEIACGFALNRETFPRLLDPGMVWKWIPCAIYAIGLLLVTKRWSHFIVFPAFVVLSIGFCHVILFSLGISVEEARAAGILFAGIPADAAWPPIGPDDFAYLDWGVVATQLPAILSVVLVALICIVLNVGALELGSGVEMNMNREFLADGTGCLIGGLGGSSPGCNTAVFSLISHANRAETRLTGLVVALAVGLVLFLGGDLLSILPVSLLGGMVVFIGIDLLDNWLVATRKTLPSADYAIVLGISLVICVVGFLEGVSLGLAAAVVFFVARFSGVDVISVTFTGRERHSKRTRPATHRAILRGQGGRVRAYCLRGYIVFGNASPMGDRLKQSLRADPAPLCLLLDFSAVTGFDASAVNVVYRSIRSARARGTQIVLSTMPERIRFLLQRGLPETEWRSLIFTENLDSGLELCEDLLIAEWDRLPSEEDARKALFDLSIDHAVRQLDRQVRFEALIERLRPWLQDQTYAIGETIVARGEKQKGMQFLTEGRATVRGEGAGARMDEHGPGDALASKAAFKSHVAEISVVAEEPCRTVWMTPSARRSLEQEDLALTVELDRYLIETILEFQTRLLSTGVEPVLESGLRDSNAGERPV